ncbi:MAG: proprotein convertase P-domain-containing protein [Verrucomicrobiales bacterium]
MLLLMVSAVVARSFAGQPPVITRHPIPQRVTAGHSVRLIGGSSDVRASLFWERDGTILDSGFGSELILRHVEPRDGGVYRMVGRNSEAATGEPMVGEGVSREVALTVLMPTQTPGIVDQAWSDIGLEEGEVRALVPRADGGCMIGGDFTTAAGFQLGHVARLRPDGTLDLTFNAGSGADERVRALAAHGSGWLVGGDFTAFNGQARARLVRLSDTGQADPLFSPPSLESNVRALAVQNVVAEDRVLVGLSGPPFLVRLRSDGKADSAFNANVASAGLNGRVSAIKLQADGRILLGGGFYFEGAWPFHRIGRLHADGTLDTAFVHGAGTGAEGEVLAVAPAANGRVFVGGRFTAMHGQARFYLARLLANGQLDTDFNPSPNDTVNSLAALPDGRVYVAGDFSRIDGGSVRSLARLDSSGRRDGTWSPASFDDRSLIVAVGNDGRVFAGGEFTQPHSLMTALLGAVADAPPVVIEPPRTQYLDEGAGGSLVVAALASPDTTFTWSRGGSVVAVTQTGEWPISVATADFAGIYSVEIANSLGSVVSPPFVVEVRPLSKGARPLTRSIANGLPRTLPNQGVFTATAALPGVTVAELWVTVAIEHYDTNDLVIDLIAPDGQRVRLFDPDLPTNIRRGRNMDFTCFADAAPVRINDAAAPYVGTFRPSPVDAGLGTLNGAQMAGDWSLQIEDFRDDENTGTLRFFAVDVFGPPPQVDLAHWLDAPLRGGNSDVVVLSDSVVATVVHWPAPPGYRIDHEITTDFSNWELTDPASWLVARRFADQRLQSSLRLPPLSGRTSCFLRLHLR